MNPNIANNSDQETSCAQTELQEQDQQLTKAVEKRVYKRFSCAVRVSVEIPFLPNLVFGARNLSSKGMFLTFPDEGSGEDRFDGNLLGKSKHLMILFSIVLHGTRHQCQVRARIIRVAQRGMAVEFGDQNPWQLTALVDAYARAYPETDVAKP